MAWYAPWRNERLDKVVVASASILTAELRKDSKRRTAMDWQDRSLYYSRRLGEAWFGSQFYARALPKLEFLAGEIVYDPETGKMEKRPTQNQKAIDTLHEIRDTGGGLGRFLYNYGRLMFGPGEGYSVGMMEDGEQTFRFLSHKEVRVKSTDANTYQIIDAPGLKPEELAAASDDAWKDISQGQAIVARFWRPDAEYSWLADSPMQPALDTCEELMLLTQAIHAKATSRVAGAGILFIPQSVAQALPDIPAQTPEENQMTPMMRLIARGMLTPIQDPKHAAAVVPIVITGPDEMGDKIKHIVLYSNDKEWPEAALRERAVERYAIGADFPMEYLVGLKNLNHWNAWQVDDATWGGHVQPVAEMLVSDMTQAIFRPKLEAKGMTPEEAAGFCILYDESEVVTRPDKTAPTLDAYKAGIANRASVLRESGLDPEDEMVDDEYKRWVGIQVGDPGMAVTGEVTPAAEPSASGQESGGDSGGSGDTHEPPPEPVKGEEDSSASARLLGAAELAVFAAREKAGARLATLARKCPPCLQEIQGVPKPMIAATLGPEALDRQPNALNLVRGAGEAFMQQCVAWGFDLTTAGYFAGAVERHAASSLYEEVHPGVPTEILEWVESAQRVP